MTKKKKDQEEEEPQRISKDIFDGSLINIWGSEDTIHINLPPIIYSMPKDHFDDFIADIQKLGKMFPDMDEDEDEENKEENEEEDD